MNQSALAEKAGASRSTVINAEDKKTTVRFSTLAQLMQALGFGYDSAELREMALLWLEAETNVKFSSVSDALLARQHILSGEQTKNSVLLDQLRDIIAINALSPSQIKLLTWAAARAPALEILSNAQQLAGYSEQGERIEWAVAEDKAKD